MDTTLSVPSTKLTLVEPFGVALPLRYADCGFTKAALVLGLVRPPAHLHSLIMDMILQKISHFPFHSRGGL